MRDRHDSIPAARSRRRNIHKLKTANLPHGFLGFIGTRDRSCWYRDRCTKRQTLSNVVSERGKLSQHVQRSLSDYDGARLRERLLVSRPIEELRRAHRYPSCEEAAKRRTRKGHRGVPAHGQCCIAVATFTAQDRYKGRRTW